MTDDRSLGQERAGRAVDLAWREHWGRLLGLLVGRFRDLDLAQDALADAFEAAARTWPGDGVPDNPPAWLLTAARRRALDRLRGEQVVVRTLPLLATDRLRAMEATENREVIDELADPVADEELKLLFLTAHPALAPQAQAALALRLVLGLPTAEVARLFLVSEATMAARITRAKKKIATAALPFTMPEPDALPGRAEIVGRAIYLCFTAGYAPATGDVVVRHELAGEAIRLARLLLSLPACRGSGPSSVVALLALMLLQHSRRDARVDDTGHLVLLPDQDRSRWHHAEIEEGLALLRQLRPTTGWGEELRLQAVIASRHLTSGHADDTDWTAIASDYRQLDQLTCSPVVRLNRAVAVAKADGPAAGLALLDGLEEQLPHSHRVAAVRGELLARAGDVAAARQALAKAVARAGHGPERAHMQQRLDSLG